MGGATGDPLSTAHAMYLEFPSYREGGRREEKSPNEFKDRAVCVSRDGGVKTFQSPFSLGNHAETKAHL